MKLFFSLITIAFFVNSGFTQNIHLFYKTDFAGINMKNIGKKDRASHFLDGYKHVLIFDDKKSVSYFDTNENETEASRNIKLNLCDKKKAAYKNIDLAYKTETSSYEYKTYHRPWKDLKTYAYNALEEGKASIEFSNKTKTINTFDCKLAYIIEKDSKILVWYTDAFSYNWTFNDYHYLIPGTIVLVKPEAKETILFELKERKLLNIDNTKISQGNLDLILQNWKNKY